MKQNKQLRKVENNKQEFIIGGKRNNGKQKFIVSIIFGFLIVILLGCAVYKYVVYKNFESITFEITLLIFVFLVYVFYALMLRRMLLPESLTGRKLPISENANDKKIRFKNYVVKSVMFAVVFSLLDISARLFMDNYKNFFNFESLGSIFNVIANIFVLFLIAFIVSLFLESIIGEIAVKKYNNDIYWRKK